MDKKEMDYIKDDIVVVNEDGAEVKLFPSTVDEQVYVQDGINGPTTLDVELELLRNKKHELSLLDYSIKREAFIENPNPQVNSSSFDPQTSVNYTIELGCVHDGSIYGFALWDWTITENDTSFEINIINQQTNEVSRTLLTGRNAYSALGISFENYSLTTNAKGQYADQGFYIFIALGDKVTSDQHILAVLLLNLDTLKATMIGSSVYSGRNITNVVYSEENSGFYVFTKKADSEDVYVSFFNVIEKSFENVESKLLFETNTASEYYLYLYNTPSIQLLKDMNRKGNNGIFVMGSNAGGAIKTDRLLVFSIDRSNKNNPSINFLSEAYTLDTIHDEPYCNYAGNPIIYCERQTSTIYYLRPYYVPGKMYNTAGCFHRVTFDLERKMFVNEQNLENVISGLKSSMDDYCFIDCVMTCEGDSIYIIGGTQHKLVKVGTSMATRTRPQRLAVKINALLSNGFQEIEHSEEVINPFVTVKNILEVTPVNKGFQIYDESQNKPMWWNGESWETYPTASSEPDNSFETDWGTLGASELFKEDLSAPTFDIGDWTTTTLNGEPVIKSKKITSSQSTELTVTLTNITSLTVGLRASSESNYDKFYFHLNDEQMFYLTGDGTTKQETYADLDSSQSYKLKFVYTKDSSIDKFDDCGYITKIEYTQPSTSNEENNPIEVQMVRGHNSSIQSYAGKDGQLVYNQTTKRLHTMNGATRGGHPLALLSDVPTIPSTYDATKITLSSSNFTSSHVKGALDELFQSVDNGKTLIASAITDKGVETSKSDTFETMAENIEKIQTFDPDASDFYPGGNDFTFKSRTNNAAIQELYSTNESQTYQLFNYKYNEGATQSITLTYPLIAMNGVYNSYEWPNLYHERIGEISESKYVVDQMKLTDLYNRTWATDRKYILRNDSESGETYCITYNVLYSTNSKSGNKGYTTISRVNKDDFTLEKIGERPGCRTSGTQSFFKVGIYDHKIFFIDGYEMQWAIHPDNPDTGIGEYHNILAFDLINKCWINYGELPTACYYPRTFAYDGWLYLLNYASKNPSNYSIYKDQVVSCRINLKTKEMEPIDNFVTSTSSFSSSTLKRDNVIHLGDQYYLLYLLDVGVVVLDANTYTYEKSSGDNPYYGWTFTGVSEAYGDLLSSSYSDIWFKKGDDYYIGRYKCQMDKRNKHFKLVAYNDSINSAASLCVTRNNKDYLYWMDPQWTYMSRCESDNYGNVQWLTEGGGFHPSSKYSVAVEVGKESNYLAVYNIVNVTPEDNYSSFFKEGFFKGTFVNSYVNIQLYDLNNHQIINVVNGDTSIIDTYLWTTKRIDGIKSVSLNSILWLHNDRLYLFFRSTNTSDILYNRTVVFDIKTRSWSEHPYTFPMTSKKSTTTILRDSISNFQRWGDRLIICAYGYNIFVMEDETGQWTDTGILFPNEGSKDPLGVYKDKVFYQYGGMRDTYIGYLDLVTEEINDTWVKLTCNRNNTSNYMDSRYIYIMNGKGTGYQSTQIGWGSLNYGEVFDCETGEMTIFDSSSASCDGRGIIARHKNNLYHILPANGPSANAAYGSTSAWIDTYELTETGERNPESTWIYNPSIKKSMKANETYAIFADTNPITSMGDNRVFMFKAEFRNLLDSVEDNNYKKYSKKALISYDLDTMKFKRHADITADGDFEFESVYLYLQSESLYYKGHIYCVSSYPSYAIYKIDVSTSVMTKVCEPTKISNPILLGIKNNKIYYYNSSSFGIACYDLDTQAETLKSNSSYISSSDSSQKYYISMSDTHIYVNRITTASTSKTQFLTTIAYDLATWNTRKITNVEIEDRNIISYIYNKSFFVVNNDIYVGVYREVIIPTEMKHPQIFSGRESKMVYIYRFDTTKYTWNLMNYVPYVLASKFFSDGIRVFAVGSHSSDSKSVSCSRITELTLETKRYNSVLPNGGNTITLTNPLPDIPVNIGKGRLRCVDDPAIELYIK